jgi:murein DD-endopeptidase MepM/ murein hydrolase activator NlpD
MRVHPITGAYKLHDGTDFGSSCGTPIRAAADGTVLETSYAGGYGNQVVIEHGNIDGDYVATSYNHLSGFAVGSGENVDRGEVIGYVGTTGMSTGCHLHFMVYLDGSTTNPMNFL